MRMTFRILCHFLNQICDLRSCLDLEVKPLQGCPLYTHLSSIKGLTLSLIYIHLHEKETINSNIQLITFKDLVVNFLY